MTDQMPRQLHLNAFIYPAGHHEAAWRHPWTRPDEIFRADYYQAIAREAEAAAFDAVFLADSPSLPPTIAHSPVGRLEPITLLTAIATATSRIGLIATASTTYYEPYNLARLFGSLDHLSGGRAGWNIVTTTADLAAANFGLPAHPDPAVRYERAAEFVDATIALWDAWSDDAVLADRATGRYVDPARIRPPRFAGAHVQVAGALPHPRTPQGRPVLVQAGASNAGRAFAARYAEAIFTAHQRLGDAQAFHADVKAQVARAGRQPDQVLVLPGISPFIADTEAEALALQREFDDLIVPEFGITALEATLGRPVHRLGLDDPVPPDLAGAAGDVVDNQHSRRQVVAGIIERERPTLRQLLRRLAGARGHRVVAGAPEQVADTIEQWFREGAADGFNVMPPWYPGGLSAFTTTVVPILRERGLFRDAYTGTTLRAHLGLPRPADRPERRATESAVGSRRA